MVARNVTLFKEKSDIAVLGSIFVVSFQVTNASFIRHSSSWVTRNVCPGSSEVPRNILTRWDVSSIPVNGIVFTKKTKKQNKKCPTGGKRLNR